MAFKMLIFFLPIILAIQLDIHEHLGEITYVGEFDIIRDQEVIWETNLPEGFATKVIVKGGFDRYIAILHRSGSFTLLHKGVGWTDITGTKLDLSRLRCFNGSGLVEMGKDLQGLRYWMTPISPCSEVTFNHKCFWEGNVEAISLDLITDELFVESGHIELRLDMGLQLLDHGEELDFSDYRIEMHGEVIERIMRRRCTEVRYDGERVWEYEGGQYPLSIAFSRNTFSISLKYDFDFILLSREGVWKRERFFYVVEESSV